jgi:hypothetical protein
MTNPLQFSIDVSRVARFAQLAILFSPICARIIILCLPIIRRVHGLYRNFTRNFLTVVYTFPTYTFITSSVIATMNLCSRGNVYR